MVYWDIEDGFKLNLENLQDIQILSESGTLKGYRKSVFLLKMKFTRPGKFVPLSRGSTYLDYITNTYHVK